MFPRCAAIVFICCSFAIFTKAQDKGISISSQSRILASSFGKKLSPANRLLQSRSDTIPTRCTCSVVPQIIAGARVENLWTYEGIPNASCSGGIFTSPDQPIDTCFVSNVTYTWSIVSGGSVAEISGSNTGSTVNIAIKGNGSFMLNLVNAVTCSDNASCSYYAYYTDSAIVDSSHCTCIAGPVTIQSPNKQGNVWTYQGTVQGSCSGQYGISPNLTACSAQNTIYKWSIHAPGGVANIIGADNTSTVNIQINSNGPFSLRLDGTTACNDEKTCSNYNFYEDTAKVDTAEVKHCDCSVRAAAIEPIQKQDPIFSYRAVVQGECTGQYGIEANFNTCEVQTITYKWFVGVGTDVAEIDGPDGGPTVNVRIKKEGSFRLNVFGEVICNDSQRCPYEIYYQDSGKKNKCNISFEEDVNPIMDGGLKKWYKGPRIKRDEYVVLEAEGLDYDQVKFTCTPSDDCNETGSNKTVLLTGRVKFKWTITEGEGHFVKLGSLPEAKKEDEGEHVIFQPPIVPLPKKNDPPTTFITKIQLFVIDDNNTQPLDDTRIKNITITTKRSFGLPDDYGIEVTSDKYTLPGIPTPPDKDGQCRSIRTWELKDDLKKPEIEKPGVEDNDKMVVGEWIVLNVKDQRDPDKLKMVCESRRCDNDGHEKNYEDNVEWKWDIVSTLKDKGKIIGEPRGRFIVYEAPEKLPNDIDVVEVKITAEVNNPDGLQIKDTKEKGEIILKIHRAGVRVEYPPLEWLPEEDGSVAVKSFLVYRDANQWKTALAHQRRIHFFEMKDVSREKGVCMNDPVPNKADECHDLYMKDEAGLEAFNPDKGSNCNLDQLFQGARTKKPEKEYSITIYSRDFGSYGFLKTEATITPNKPHYESVPVLKSEVTHPGGRQKKQEYNKGKNNDNRINIPRDIDENKIADNGWLAQGEAGPPVEADVKVPDPEKNTEDDDRIPNGDGFDGDGLTAYEEYRGFRVNGAGGAVHIRTDILRKNLFIRNRNSLTLTLFKTQSRLRVYEISPEQYNGDNDRRINFNFSQPTHQNDQRGLFLITGEGTICGIDADLLGIAEVNPPACPHPAPPNAVSRVVVFAARINTFCTARGWTAAMCNNKIEQVTAHELAHACNVYHHGDLIGQRQGQRSGNVSCIMRYDNFVVTQPEAIGSIFCINAAGTGSNANNAGFGDANTTLCRGNCLGQFRVSGKQNNYPLRVTQNDCRRIRGQ